MLAEKSDKASIITKARVNDLIITDGACTGCVHEKGGASFKEFGSVIFASGGFGADFTQNSLLATHCPDLLHLTTTDCVHCTGDAIKMAEAIGAWVPTPMPKSSSSRQKRSAELLVLSLTRTETVCQ